MPDPEDDRAVRGLLGTCGSIIFAKGLDIWWQVGATGTTLAVVLLGIATIAAGLYWQLVSTYLGDAFADSARRNASDFRWWLILLLFAVGFLSMPRMIRPLGYVAELGEPTLNKYVCKRQVPSVAGARDAMLIEFGVRGKATNGFHTQIKLKSEWSAFRLWLGPPRRTSAGTTAIELIEYTEAQRSAMIKGIRDGVPPDQCTPNACRLISGFGHVCMLEPLIIDFVLFLVDVRSLRSIYVQIESATTVEPTAITFFDDIFSLDDASVVQKGGSDYGPCPD